MSLTKMVEKLGCFVELLIRCHPRGFSILLGDDPPPDSRVVHEMLSSLRVPMPSDFKPSVRSNFTEAEQIVSDSDYFDSLVSLAGGWKHINEVSREFREVSPRYWAIVIDHVKFVSVKTERYMSKLGYVADKHKVAPNTVMKYRREFPVRLATMLLMPQISIDFGV